MQSDILPPFHWGPSDQLRTNNEVPQLHKLPCGEARCPDLLEFHAQMTNPTTGPWKSRVTLHKSDIPGHRIPQCHQVRFLTGLQDLLQQVPQINWWSPIFRDHNFQSEQQQKATTPSPQVIRKTAIRNRDIQKPEEKTQKITQYSKMSRNATISNSYIFLPTVGGGVVVVLESLRSFICLFRNSASWRS